MKPPSPSSSPPSPSSSSTSDTALGDSTTDQKQALQRLWRELEKPHNAVCADCASPDPEWASITIGVFLCTKCVSIHRKMGVQVSVVRSISLDRWDSSMLDVIRDQGNAKVNNVLEKYLPSGTKPGADASLETRRAFIVAKYLDRAFSTSKDPLAQPSTLSRSDPIVEPGPQAMPVPPIRFVDYFAVVGRGDLIRPQGCGLIESAYGTHLVDRYPLLDHVHCPLQVDSLASFCFPEDAELSVSPPNPRRFAFCMTSETGIRQYAVALLFWEALQPMEIVALESQYANFKHNGDDEARASFSQSITATVARGSFVKSNVYSPKCLVLVSHWPFINDFCRILGAIYRVSLSKSPLPIERFVANLVNEIPLPPRGVVDVQFTLGDLALRISRPPPNELPLNNVRMSTLFQCLDLNNVMALLTSVLTEQKIVLCCSQWSALVDVAETICSLVFPFAWQGVYMPLLPQRLCEFVHAPVPFIAGIHPNYLHAFDMPHEIVFVNLDTNDVLMPSQDTLPKLPERALKKLLDHLRVSANVFRPNAIHAGADDSFDQAFPSMEHLEPVVRFASEGGVVLASSNNRSVPSLSAMKRSTMKRLKNTAARMNASRSPSGVASADADFPDGIENRTNIDVAETRGAFLRFFVSVLQRYRAFMAPVTDTDSSPDSVFDSEGFIREANEYDRPLLRALVETQLFERFLRDRWGFSAASTMSTLPEVVFFDECIVQKRNRSKMTKKQPTPFLDSTKYQSLNTFVVPFPSRTGIDREFYEYDVWPRFQPERFGPVRLAQPLVTDEQHRVVSTMARRVNLELMKGYVSPQLKSWDRLCDAAVLIQSRFRMWHHRREFLQLRRATLFVQQRTTYLKRTAACTTLQSFARGYLSFAHRNLVRLASAGRIVAAGFAAVVFVRRRLVVLGAVSLVQASLATVLVVNVHRHSVYLLTRMQARSRALRARRSYLVVRSRIILLQALFRGNRLRRQERLRKSVLIKEALSDVIGLWQRLHTSLRRRSRFYLALDDSSYMSLALLQQEQRRAHDEVAQIDSTEARRTAQTCRERQLVEERNRLYIAVKTTVPASVRQALFVVAGLKGGRRRKHRLVDWLWSDAAEPRASAEVLVCIERAQIDDDDDLGDDVERLRQRRTRSNLRQTTETSLDLVRRLHQQTRRLTCELGSAAAEIDRLRTQLHRLHQQQQQQQQRKQRKPRLSRPATPRVHGYRPSFI